MIESLDDAWRWHESVKKLVAMMDRVSKRYWNEADVGKTLRETLHKDGKLLEVAPGEIQERVELNPVPIETRSFPFSPRWSKSPPGWKIWILGPKRNSGSQIERGLARNSLDDLAVLLLFSVFEADVRGRAMGDLEREVATPPRHPVFRKASKTPETQSYRGSFFRLTEAYGGPHADKRTQVDQVRRYQNWVAHGRRGAPVVNITPDDAFERLERFLEILDADDPISPLATDDSAWFSVGASSLVVLGSSPNLTRFSSRTPKSKDVRMW